MFLAIGSVSAMDVSNATNTDDSNFLGNNQIVFSSQNLEVSSDNSISDTNSLNDTYDSNNENNGVLGFQYHSEDNIQAGQIPTSLNGNDTELYFKNGTSFNVILCADGTSPLANQNIIFTINDVNYTRITNENGLASIKINLNPGEYYITSTYLGNGDYGNASITNYIKVLSTISGDDVEKYYKNNTQYYAKFLDGQGNPLANTTIEFNINGVFYNRVTNENGTARLNINLDPGEYVLTAINPINGDMHSNNITVLTTIFSNDIVKYYKNGTQYYADFLDLTGSPLVNQSVSFNINGVMYSRNTNERGTARLNINLDPGEYVLTAINPINGDMHSNIIQVLPTISGNDLNMYYKDGSKFTVNVVDSKGNPLANSTVTFNVNGVFYKRVSDGNGNASLNINLLPNSYIITSTDENDLSISNNILIAKSNSTIVGSDIVIISNTSRNYTVTLTGSNNRPISSAVVHFSYNGLNLTAITDNNGNATITISKLSEGSYPITYEYKGELGYYPSNSASTLTVVNSTVILTADDLNMICKDGSSFNVTLTDLNYNPLTNETITFHINGRSYNRTTDENGTARLNINLIPGIYNIGYSYSTIGKLDYNEGSKTINISKRPTKFTADDLEMDSGERSVFKAILTDTITNDTIKDVIVTFNVNNVSYNRTTDESGCASLNVSLGTGYYTIATSLDNLIYEAESKTNHILVNGTLFVANDMDMIVNTVANYSVILKDAYGNGISEASIEFTYNGVTQTDITDANGVATIPISGLAKGDYLIIYNYTDKSFAGESYIHVLGIITISQLSSAADIVNNYIERNAALPSEVVIGDVTVSTAEYLYLLSQAIVNINNGDTSSLARPNVANPDNPGAAKDLGKLYDYVAVAANVLSIADSTGKMPNSVSSSVGDIGYDGLVYAFTRVMVYYGKEAKLPSYVDIRSTTGYTPKSVLDSKNTITDLAPYLSSSTHCDITNSAIVELANRLTDGLTSSLDKAVAIYNYVRDHISYSFYYNTRFGAAGTLNAGTGNCVDQAHLVIALYRAAGLPARYVQGTCVFSSGSTYGHVWAQVLIGDNWIVSDPTSTRNSFDNVVNWNNYNYSLKGYYSSIAF